MAWHFFPAAIQLPIGKLFLAGYGDLDCETYDEVTGVWSAGPYFSVPGHESYSASKLSDSEVLLVGGTVGFLYPTGFAAIYDALANTVRDVESMKVARVYPSIALLGSGKVLVAGGTNVDFAMTPTAELYDRASETWSPATAMSTARTLALTAMLDESHVLVVGGENANGEMIDTAEIYDANADTWESAGTLSQGRDFGAIIVRLPSGEVLVAGGQATDGHALSSAEIYDPESNSWRSAGSMSTPRQVARAVEIQGKAFVTGGAGGGLTTEWYSPDEIFRSGVD